MKSQSYHYALVVLVHTAKKTHFFNVLLIATRNFHFTSVM